MPERQTASGYARWATYVDGVETSSGTDCWYIDGGGGGGDSGGGSSSEPTYVWISLPTPPPIACQIFPGIEEREYALSTLYKEQLVLKNGGLGELVLAEDRDNMGKQWLVFFLHSSGVWVGGVYNKVNFYHSTLSFEEVVAPACED